MISFVDGFAFNYRNYSSTGNNIAIFELIFFVVYMVPIVALIVATYLEAADWWDQTTERLRGVEEDGFFGTAISWQDVFRFALLGALLMNGTWLSTYI